MGKSDNKDRGYSSESKFCGDTQKLVHTINLPKQYLRNNTFANVPLPGF